MKLILAIYCVLISVGHGICSQHQESFKPTDIDWGPDDNAALFETCKQVFLPSPTSLKSGSRNQHSFKLSRQKSEDLSPITPEYDHFVDYLVRNYELDNKFEQRESTYGSSSHTPTNDSSPNSAVIKILPNSSVTPIDQGISKFQYTPEIIGKTDLVTPINPTQDDTRTIPETRTPRKQSLTRTPGDSVKSWSNKPHKIDQQQKLSRRPSTPIDDKSTKSKKPDSNNSKSKTRQKSKRTNRRETKRVSNDAVKIGSVHSRRSSSMKTNVDLTQILTNIGPIRDQTKRSSKSSKRSFVTSASTPLSSSTKSRCEQKMNDYQTAPQTYPCFECSRPHSIQPETDSPSISSTTRLRFSEYEKMNNQQGFPDTDPHFIHSSVGTSMPTLPSIPVNRLSKRGSTYSELKYSKHVQSPRTPYGNQGKSSFDQQSPKSPYTRYSKSFRGRQSLMSLQSPYDDHPKSAFDMSPTSQYTHTSKSPRGQQSRMSQCGQSPMSPCYGLSPNSQYSQQTRSPYDRSPPHSGVCICPRCKALRLSPISRTPSPRDFDQARGRFNRRTLDDSSSRLHNSKNTKYRREYTKYPKPLNIEIPSDNHLNHHKSHLNPSDNHLNHHKSPRPMYERSPMNQNQIAPLIKSPRLLTQATTPLASGPNAKITEINQYTQQPATLKYQRTVPPIHLPTAHNTYPTQRPHPQQIQNHSIITPIQLPTVHNTYVPRVNYVPHTTPVTPHNANSYQVPQSYPNIQIPTQILPTIDSQKLAQTRLSVQRSREQLEFFTNKLTNLERDIEQNQTLLRQTLFRNRNYPQIQYQPVMSTQQARIQHGQQHYAQYLPIYHQPTEYPVRNIYEPNNGQMSQNNYYDKPRSANKVYHEKYSQE
eukprot:277820_1